MPCVTCCQHWSYIYHISYAMCDLLLALVIQGNKVLRNVKARGLQNQPTVTRLFLLLSRNNPHSFSAFIHRIHPSHTSSAFTLCIYSLLYTSKTHRSYL